MVYKDFCEYLLFFSSFPFFATLHFPLNSHSSFLPFFLSLLYILVFGHVLHNYTLCLSVVLLIPRSLSLSLFLPNESLGVTLTWPLYVTDALATIAHVCDRTMYAYTKCNSRTIDRTRPDNRKLPVCPVLK